MPLRNVNWRRPDPALWAITALLAAAALVIYLQHRDVTTLTRQAELISEQICQQAARTVATEIRRTFEAPVFETLSAVNHPLLRAGRIDLVAREFAEGLAVFPQIDRFFLWHELTDRVAPGEALFFSRRPDDGNGGSLDADVDRGVAGRIEGAPTGALAGFQRDPPFGRLVLGVVREQARSQWIYGAAVRQVGAAQYDLFIRIFWVDANRDRFFAVLGYAVSHEAARARLFDTLYRRKLAPLLALPDGPELELRILDEAGRSVFGPPEPPPEKAGRARFALQFYPADEIQTRMAAAIPTRIWHVIVSPKAGSLAAMSPSGAPGYWLSGASILLMLAALTFVLQGRQRASQLSRMQAEFVSHVSHQLKTPLSLLSAVSETLDLERVRSPEKLAEYVTIIRAETHRLTQLVERILEFSRVQARPRKYELEAVELVEHVRGTVEAFDRALPGATIRIETDGPSPVVPADPMALEQILVNLLDNAVKYSPREKTITVAVGCDGDEAIVEVRDRGIGLAPEERQKIFERFYRGSGASLHRQGFGLGLAIVRELVAAHHGRVEVESVGGQGTTFRVRLPLIVRKDLEASRRLAARTCAPAEERRGAQGSPQATEPGCGAEPHQREGG